MKKNKKFNSQIKFLAKTNDNFFLFSRIFSYFILFYFFSFWWRLKIEYQNVE